MVQITALLAMHFVTEHVFSIINKGEENCADFIEAHKQCMRELGFKV